jgi:hypothetical protein
MAFVRQGRSRRAPAVEVGTVPAWGALAVTACILAGTAVAAASEDQLVGPPGPVLLVGDSLFFSSADEIEPALRRDGWEVETIAFPGAGIHGGGYIDQFEWVPRLEEELDTLQPEVVVVELGTNGCGEGCDSVREAVDDLMQAFTGVDHVLWLTVRDGAPRPTDVRDINRELVAADEVMPNLDLLPFHGWMDNRPDQVQYDGVHLTKAGQQAIAGHIRDALRAGAGIEG